MSPSSSWTATVRVRPEGLATVGWLERALAPEAAREVPRARATVGLLSDRELEIRVEASDAGAMRAALNTYLGWIDLALATLVAAAPPP